MLTASKPLADRYGPPSLRFKGHAPIYPVCWIYNNTRRRDYVFKELTGAPAFIQGGELDGDVTSSIVRPPNASSRILLRAAPVLAIVIFCLTSAWLGAQIGVAW